MKTKSEIQMKSFNVRRFFIYTHVSYLQLLIWIQITYSLMKSLIMSKLVDKEYLRNMNAECVHNEYSYIISNVIEVKILPYLEFPKERY